MYIIPYDTMRSRVWDEFVQTSRNATFMHNRRFMDYHADRFPDKSLILYDNQDRLVGLLPATARDGVVSSHAGLTFGGWLLGPSKPSALDFLEGWDLMVDYYRSAGYHTLKYKPVPHIYHTYPAEEDLYALFRSNATIETVLLSAVMQLSNHLKFNTGARRHVVKGIKQGLEAVLSDDYDAFWVILEERLRERYDAHPVHTVDEIKLLAGRFPENIKLWLVYGPAKDLLAGTVLFIGNGVVKAQYIASTLAGRDVNAVDILFDTIVGYYTQQGASYIDMGPSCEDNGRSLNQGLVNQKYGYGARGIVYTTYRIDLK